MLKVNTYKMAPNSAKASLPTQLRKGHDYGHRITGPLNGYWHQNGGNKVTNSIVNIPILQYVYSRQFVAFDATGSVAIAN